MAMVVWITSVTLLLIMGIVFAIPFFSRYMAQGREMGDIAPMLVSDPNFLLWQVIAALPAHALTLFLIWAVVTGLGKRPFWRSVSFAWGDRRDAIAIAGGILAAVGLLLLAGFISRKIGGSETIMDRLIQSSTSAKYAVAFLAAISAPLVEELIYRGVIYPATQRGFARLGHRLSPAPRNRDTIQIGSAILAVFFVSILFAGVHIDQYKNNLGVITAIALLSFVLTGSRAVTGRVLPGFIIHFVFNGIQAFGILYLPNVDKKTVAPAPTGAALVHLLSLLPIVN